MEMHIINTKVHFKSMILTTRTPLSLTVHAHLLLADGLANVESLVPKEQSVSLEHGRARESKKEKEEREANTNG